jgi:DNA-binding transcriptional LysR family regulator
MMISLRQLQHVLAVAEHRNFGGAAAALHITRPALSRSILSIKGIVGASLFDLAMQAFGGG